jgi:tetratricopeptide (TPR) repeat protein
VAAIPARYVLERRDWKSAASLEPVLAEFPWDRFPWASAITSFARALGAAHIGDTAIAEREIAAMEAMRNKLVEAKNEYWAAQVEVQRLGAASALAQARGEGGRAVELARSAAELEQSMDKHPATPGAVLPARELLGDLLLDQGDAAGALASYRAVLQTEPNRFRSVLGVARAAEKSGDTAAATAAYGNLVGLAMEADAARPELAEARRFLGN